MFLKHKISLLKWFPKDHVTLKSGVITDEYTALPSQILKHIEIETKNIT